MQEVAPTTSESEPAEHVRHAVWPVAGWYVPGAQGVEAAGPAGHFQPAGHVTELLVALPGQ